MVQVLILSWHSGHHSKVIASNLPTQNPLSVTLRNIWLYPIEQLSPKIIANTLTFQHVGLSQKHFVSKLII